MSESFFICFFTHKKYKTSAGCHFRMNSDAQVEINMFLRATEMNQANINLGGFFDVNRTLFKSVSDFMDEIWLGVEVSSGILGK